MDDWRPLQTAEGKVYFYNHTTQETAWERPQQQRYFPQNQPQARSIEMIQNN